MQNTRFEQPIIDFYDYPPIGGDDWRYAFETARIRALEMQMLTTAILTDMANAEGFDQAADLLTAGRYTLPGADNRFARMESLLQTQRAELRRLFGELCIDKAIVRLFAARVDFANLRLAVRRAITEKTIGTDYSDQGNVPPERFQNVFGPQGQTDGTQLPDYLQQAAERAVLDYYQNKQIPRIDYAIDAEQAQYNLAQARKMKSPFLLGLFKIQNDLNNIRTLFRLKFTESEVRNVFLKGGFLELPLLQKARELGYEAIASLFFATPYYRVVETGASYLASEKSFLKLEQQCRQHLTGYLATTSRITAGPQPIVAFLLRMENEIRNVRLILTAKKNNLETKLILDRIA